MGYHLLDSPKAMLQRYPNLRDLIQKHKHHMRTDKDCATFAYALDDKDPNLADIFIQYCILCGVNVVEYLDISKMFDCYTAMDFSKLQYEVTVPSETIPMGAFAFSNISEVTLPNATIIEGEAFKGSDIELIRAPKLKEIWNNAFGLCTSLRSIRLPSVENIQSSVFNGCESLTYAEFSNVTEVGRGAFRRCHKLKELTLSGATVSGRNNDELNSFREWIGIDQSVSLNFI